MKERVKTIFRKVQNELKPAGFKEKEHISFYRLVSFLFSKRGQRRIWRLIRKFFVVVGRVISGKKGMAPTYSKWLKRYNRRMMSQSEVASIIAGWKNPPLISVIIPVYNPKISYLEEAIQSVEKQYYTNWEICISDDCSNEETRTFLAALRSIKPHIKVNFRKENGHISANSNSAVALSSGSHLCFLDQDDLIAEDALFFVAERIIKTDADIIYSDEDKINDKGEREQPFFKPQWSPHTLWSKNYINHLAVIKKTLFDEVGGFRVGFEGAQDHDLWLRATTKAICIERIPEVLYHWRIHHESTSSNPRAKSWAFDAGVRAVTASVTKMGFNATVTPIDDVPGNYNVELEVNGAPKVTIIIPTKDKADVLDTALRSIFSLTTYPNFEVLVVDNNSTEQATIMLRKKYETEYKEQFSWLSYQQPFNYSAIQNFAAAQAKGDYLLLLNNDTEVTDGEWIRKMLSFAQLPNVGAVGAKLFFPNGKLQHVGVVLGIRGIVGHVYVGSDGDHQGYYQSNRLHTNYSAVTAACLMVKRERFEEVGGFEEELAIEYNDVDFCLKLCQQGYYNLFLPSVQLIHYESLTRGHPAQTRASNRQSIKEGDYFCKKWKTYIDDDPFYNPNLSREYTEFQYDVE